MKLCSFSWYCVKFLLTTATTTDFSWILTDSIQLESDRRCLIVALLTEKILPAVATSFSEYLQDLAPGIKTTEKNNWNDATAVKEARASSVRSHCKVWDAYET